MCTRARARTGSCLTCAPTCTARRAASVRALSLTYCIIFTLATMCRRTPTAPTQQPTHSHRETPESGLWCTQFRHARTTHNKTARARVAIDSRRCRPHVLWFGANNDNFDEMTFSYMCVRIPMDFSFVYVALKIKPHTAGVRAGSDCVR